MRMGRRISTHTSPTPLSRARATTEELCTTLGYTAPTTPATVELEADDLSRARLRDGPLSVRFAPLALAAPEVFFVASRAALICSGDARLRALLRAFTSSVFPTSWKRIKLAFYVPTPVGSCVSSFLASRQSLVKRTTKIAATIISNHS
jgi:hypothetical protein